MTSTSGYRCDTDGFTRHTGDINPKKRPPIVCLCGSTRFWKTFQEVSLKLTKAREIVLAICAAASDDDHGITGEEKEIFNELHMRKIDLCDYVFVLNVDGYIGEQTRGEIAYATEIAKPIRYLENAK